MYQNQAQAQAIGAIIGSGIKSTAQSQLEAKTSSPIEQKLSDLFEVIRTAHVAAELLREKLRPITAEGARQEAAVCNPGEPTALEQQLSDAILQVSFLSTELSNLRGELRI